MTTNNELVIKDVFNTSLNRLYLIPIAMLSYYSISNVTTTFNYLKDRDSGNFSFSFVHPIILIS